jgi:RNA-directed DNA polymerase
MQTDTALKRLENLPDLARAGKRLNGLFRLLSYRPLWTAGLNRIKRNHGAGTPGIDRTKVTDLGDADIETLISQLMDGTYRPRPVRRVNIPKANGKLRPLGIPTAKDRLIQEVVRSILDQIYEPTFSNHSHGFRKGRSCHTALTHIVKVWTGTKWLVEVDIKGYFDNIDHSVLLRLLEQRVDDRKFLSLIQSMLKAGYLEEWRYHTTYSGTPQGGIISPLLANIYLNELDYYVEEFIRNFNKGKSRARSAEYHCIGVRAAKYRKRITRLRDAGREDEAKRLMAVHDECRAKLATIPSVDPMDPNYKRLRYVRYADDFLFGVIGSRNEAKEVMQAVIAFLTEHLNLEVSTEKSGIRKASDGARFLGYDVKVYSSSRKVVQNVTGRHRGIMRSMSERIQLSVPREKVQAFAKTKGYGHFDLTKGVHRGGLFHCEDVEIANVYNAEIRGFANYYALAFDVKQKLGKLHWLWSQSLFRTLAGKHRSSVRKVLRHIKISPGKYTIRQVRNGKEVRVDVWQPRDLDTQAKNVWAIDQISSTSSFVYSRSNLTDRILASQCVECGTTQGPFEAHHKNPLRKTKNTRWAQLDAGRQRKTVTLCVRCHQLLHQGRLPDRRQIQVETESRMT